MTIETYTTPEFELAAVMARREADGTLTFLPHAHVALSMLDDRDTARLMRCAAEALEELADTLDPEGETKGAVLPFHLVNTEEEGQ